jgi:murein DD-endopeptidase MepM/ murein hydrolase activator NlpD
MRTRVLIVVLCIFLAACAGGNSAQSQLSASQSVEVDQITSTLVTTPSQVLSITPSPTGQVITPHTPTPETTPTPVIEICSPLEIHPLDELPQIIGDPYDPPRPGREERHHGIDFAYYHYQDRDSMLGEPVQSVFPGVVAGVMDGQYPYGNMVIIEADRSDFPETLKDRIEIPPGQSLYVLYAHLDQPPLAAPGDEVAICQPLGEVGMSGNTDIPHLHIEFRLGPAGQVFESMRFYDTRASQEEMDTYVLWRTSGIFQHFDPMQLLGPETNSEATPEGD